MQVDVDPSNIIEGKRRRAKVDYSVRLFPSLSSLPSSLPLFLPLSALPDCMLIIRTPYRAPKPSKKSQTSQTRTKMTRTLMRLFPRGTTMKRKSRKRTRTRTRSRRSED